MESPADQCSSRGNLLLKHSMMSGVASVLPLSTITSFQAKEILEIADAPCKDAVEVAHARNRLDTRKWLASKLAPRKYGDRVEQCERRAPLPAICASPGRQRRAAGRTQDDQPR
jgi:hypothetical protein